ncbi:MAG TPA: phospholipase C, phosphocholine-specific [Fimbriimonadaceae bacterium]|nr:phospholipase C, phosphocholine-specific [Fimbriimonadaceae bacterium]
MQTRREFLRNAAALTGTAFIWGTVPEAIARAFEIDPDKGTTFLDAEHVVILMQENRSFDHCYGALRGVRGYRDPRAHVQPNGRKVWFQTDAHGDTYPPFRLDMKGSNVTWIGGLLHSWPDQVDARNGGHYDKWLIAKPRKEMPFTLGYYTREDIPFYYSLADAFTVCDQAFCSSLTGTTPNRLYLWTGTIRKDAGDPARVMNGDTDYGVWASWTTFPERLEEAGISWTIYQNELSADSGFQGEEDPWLANFTDNPIEWFSQYQVGFAKGRRRYIQHLLDSLPSKIDQCAQDQQGQKEQEKLKAELKAAQAEHALYNDETWEALSAHAKVLHERAFATNEGDPDYRTLDTLTYHDGETERSVKVPKGDTLYRFRQDVNAGKLPAVSWIVAPEHFSDHPGSAWYGAWYVSEVLGILTKNPEVWKKTIFILCYDENDGYFDHVPPFIAPHPGRPETGKVSEGIDTAVDVSDNHHRDHSIGLGFRTPLVVCSPWSRGGCVNSQVFDHTSVIQLVETWLAGKGKNVRETNISDWRRTVCGDLSSIFRPYKGEAYELPKPLDRNAVIEGIHQARFKASMKKCDPLTADEIASLNVGVAQESGTRPSCSLPYELSANGSKQGGQLKITMEAGNRLFGKQAAGSPFNAYSYGEQMLVRAYAVKAGDSVSDTFDAAGKYDVRIDGPNGFMRHFNGDAGDPNVGIVVLPKGDRLEIHVKNHGSATIRVTVRDESYGASDRQETVGANGATTLAVPTKDSKGWYDFTVIVDAMAYRYAGRIETGAWSISDPAMG